MGRKPVSRDFLVGRRSPPKGPTELAILDKIPTVDHVAFSILFLDYIDDITKEHAGLSLNHESARRKYRWISSAEVAYVLVSTNHLDDHLADRRISQLHVAACGPGRKIVHALVQQGVDAI